MYWNPIWQVLDGQFALVLANAMHLRNIPGRQSDGSDATGIADLLAHGLIRGSFVPPAPVHELRDFTRTRKLGEGACVGKWRPGFNSQALYRLSYPGVAG